MFKFTGSFCAGIMIAMQAFAQEVGDGWGDSRISGIGGIFGPILMLLLLAAFIIAMWGVLSVDSRGGHKPLLRDSEAWNALLLRYAKGEIDTAEFEDRKRKLQT